MPQIQEDVNNPASSHHSSDQGRKNEDHILDLIFGSECSNCGNKEKNNYIKPILISLLISVVVVLILYLALTSFMANTLSPGQIYLALGITFLLVMVACLILLRPKPQKKDEDK